MTFRLGEGRNGSRAVGGASRLAGVAAARLLAILIVAPVATPLAAQTLNDRLDQSRRESQVQPAQLLVEARELVYDRDSNKVSAVGDVHLYYQGRVLEADRVTYDRTAKRVFAEGNAKLTDEQGNVYYGSAFELTDDFKDGFINSLRVESKDKTQFTAPRAERIGGETTIFEKGVYTAYPCCQPEGKPPLWQVRAARIIHNNAERMVYYEDARLEFWGVPVAYIPYFGSPDATVRRKSGFLSPKYVASTALGFGASVPYFWNLAPNYDLTLTPTVLFRQGFLGEAEWRHRLEHGSYNLRVAGVNQLDPDAFLEAPFGARNKRFRGSIETTGKFLINERWTAGWDVALMTDKWFFQNYKVRSESINVDYNYFRESISTVYLTGKGERSFFDARGFYFRGLSYQDWQKQIPVVGPVIDYDRRFDGPGLLGGEFALSANISSIQRDAAHFVNLGGRAYLLNTTQLGSAIFPLYDTCTVFQKGQCIVRGVSGSYTRATAQATWRRKIIDPIGQVWTPFASIRADGAWLDLSRAGYQNANLPNFIDASNSFVGRAMPSIGLEYRFPFVATTQAWGTHVIEPIARIVARPSETQIGKMPNEDAQSLVFDDTTLFAWDKFSGYDRVEGGTRANVGAQYTITTDSGFYANALFGQSFHLAGANSFEKADLANTGLNSGLDSGRSDYVGRLQITPTSLFSVIGRARFDDKTFAARRVEVQGTTTIDRLSLSAIYARYGAQPELGQDKPREGLVGSAYLRIADHWNVNASALFDLDRHDSPTINTVGASTLYRKSPVLSVGYFSLGAGYKDEATTFAVTYTNTVKDAATGQKERAQAILLRLELRTLGAANVSQNISTGSGASTDGVNR